MKQPNVPKMQNGLPIVQAITAETILHCNLSTPNSNTATAHIVAVADNNPTILTNTFSKSYAWRLRASFYVPKFGRHHSHYDTPSYHLLYYQNINFGIVQSLRFEETLQKIKHFFVFGAVLFLVLFFFFSESQPGLRGA
jgi:hypothetical protein